MCGYVCVGGREGGRGGWMEMREFFIIVSKQQIYRFNIFECIERRDRRPPRRAIFIIIIENKECIIIYYALFLRDDEDDGSSS